MSTPGDHKTDSATQLLANKPVAEVGAGSGPGNVAGNVAVKLRVEKNHAFGLLLPQNQRYFIKSLDQTTDADLGLLFTTTKCHYVDILSGLPPPFEILSAQSNQQSAVVGRIVPHGWQGVFTCRAELHVAVGEGKTVQWDLRRLGSFSDVRSYDLRKAPLDDGTAGDSFFVWKGSKKDVKEARQKAKAEGKKVDRVHKGNLKLVDAHGEVIALWEQHRSNTVLGDVVLLPAANGRVSVEVVMTSALTIVMAERATGYNWLGGLGK